MFRDPHYDYHGLVIIIIAIAVSVAFIIQTIGRELVCK